MTTTAGDLVSEASSQLHGWGSTADRITPLSADIGPTDTTFTVDFAFGQAVGITPGVVEIDSEQLYVTNVNADTGVCTLAHGFGRGYNSTTATSHTAGTSIISRPKFPRAQILRQINNIVGGLYPQLFAVKTFTGVVTYPSNTYTLPGTTGPLMVLDAQWQDPVGNWHKIFSYSVDAFDSTLRLGGAPVGRPLRVVYAVEPTVFASESDNFTLTGLSASCANVLTLGVVAMMVSALDISRAQMSSVEQSDRARQVPPNQGINSAKFVMAEYQMRLRNEASSLRKQFPTRIVRTF
jgi:hypothetical protein